MSVKLTPRERVSHKDPDQVPIILGGSANHLTEQRYVELRDHFNLSDFPRRTLVGYYTTPDYNPILEQLETDFRFLHLRPPVNFFQNSLLAEFEDFTDEWGLTRKLLHGHYILEGHLPGMDPVGLKKDFGKGLVFQGGVDIKNVLNKGTIDDVYNEVKLRINQMGHDGGYILAPAHNFGNDIPLENM